MTVLRIAVWAGFLATAGSMLVCLLALVKPRWQDRVFFSLAGAWVLVSVPLGLLVWQFLAGRLDVFFVWSNMEQSYPWWLRLAGVWGGQEGTFLLWAWFALGAVLVEEHRSSSPAWPVARAVASVASVLLLVPPIVLGVGWETASFGLTGDGSLVRGAAGPSPLSLRPEGAGLNPLLESPYMAIHPVVTFLGYGLATIPFAYGFARLAAGRSGWLAPARRWGRWAWLAMLSGLVLGALWAYHVLSFGGYWIWDPVEVANLLPFLVLTLFLHAAPARRSGGFGLLAPGSAVLVFAMVMFTDFVVRSGLWSSVHAFLPTGVSVTMENPVARLLASARETFQARYAVSLLAVTVGAVSGGACAFHARDQRRGSLVGRVAWGGALVYGLVAVLGLAWPEGLVSVLERVVVVAGAGRPLVGVVGVLLVAAAPFVAGLFAMPEELEVGLRSRSGQLVWACAALGVAFAATVVLLVVGVNGYGERVFWARAPFVAAPVLALMAVAFPAVGFQRWVSVVAAGLGVGVVLRLVMGSWAWAAVPVAGVALVGAGARFVRVARPTVGGRASWQGGLLLASGVMGLVQWASPGVVAVGGVAVASPAWFVPVGLVASGVAIAAPVLEGRGAPSWVGPVAGVVAVGYGMGAVLALVAWWVRPGVHGPRGGWRSVGVPLVHVGVALVVLGVAVSTFGASGVAFEREDPLVRGEEASWGAASLELVGGEVVRGEEGVEAVSATVHVREGGVFVAEERLTLTYHRGAGVGGQGSFVPEESPVTRAWWGDVALNADTGTPLSVKLADGNGTWVTANGPRVDTNATGVDAVSLGVERLPLVNALWAGAVVMGLGMGARLAGQRRA